MLRLFSMAFVLILAGCISTATNGAADTRTIKTTTPSEKAGPMELSPQKTPTGNPTHVVVSDAVYYSTGPQQARAPDGTFKAGTKVYLLSENGSYVVVQTSDGTVGHVVANAIEPID